MITGLLMLAAIVVVYTMIAKSAAQTIVTAPMVFIGLGVLFSTTGFLPGEEAKPVLHLVAEVALVVLLFLEAAQTDLTALRKRHVWPVRMLFVGLPLSIVLGTLMAGLFLPTWPLVAAALVAAILAPTDVALGQAVITNPVVPERVRRALTVEGGLNDGIALPVVLLFAGLTVNTMSADTADWAIFGLKQLALGPLVGLVVGLIGGNALIWAQKRGLTSAMFEGIGALALAGTAYLAAINIGGNGFLAAFVAGLAFGNVLKGRCKFVYEFTESEGQMLSWAAFFLLGLALVPGAIEYLTLTNLAIIFSSLFVVRPLAVWLSLVGTEASHTTRLFFGWFGPRGLATALFALVILPELDPVLAEPILALAINAVWISALLHGLSAVPAANWYARIVSRMGDCPEVEPITRSARPLVTRQ